jgi:hypothetical protein
MPCGTILPWPKLKAAAAGICTEQTVFKPFQPLESDPFKSLSLGGVQFGLDPSLRSG